MPKIKVTRPFTVRFERGKAPREFTKGEHTLTKDELDHWFVQGCIDEGRAAVLPGKAAKAEGSSDKDNKPAKRRAMASKAGLEKKNKKALVKVGAVLGLTLTMDDTKADMITAIIEAQEAA